MVTNIKINSADLNKIDEELVKACEAYSNALKDLDEDITKLTSGGFQGSLAEVLLEKYEDKKPALAEIGQQAEDIKEFSKNKTKGFYQVHDEIKGIMH